MITGTHVMADNKKPAKHEVFHYHEENTGIMRISAMFIRYVQNELDCSSLISWAYFLYCALSEEFESHCSWELHPRVEIRAGLFKLHGF